MYLKQLNDPLPYTNFLEENPSKVRLTGKNYRRTLRRLFGRGMENSFRLSNIEKLTKISKYDLGKIMSVIRHDYYKLVGQYR